MARDSGRFVTVAVPRQRESTRQFETAVGVSNGAATKVGGTMVDVAIILKARETCGTAGGETQGSYEIRAYRTAESCDIARRALD